MSSLFEAATQLQASKTSSKGSSTMTSITKAKASTARATARKTYTSTPATSRTENGDVTNASTGSKVLDLFSKGGAVRNFSEADVIKLIKPALKEELNLAVACIFYLRDILKGQGERRFFRIAMVYLANTLSKEQITNLIELVPVYGRWDDLFALRGTESYSIALKFYAAQLSRDTLDNEEGNSISLAAKWAPSEKAGTQTRLHWKDLVAYFPTARQYRLTVSNLRKKLQIIESKMCADEWSAIDYSSVPSRANIIYRKAFKKHDGKRYTSHIEEVLAMPAEQKQKAMKTGTLAPYEVVHKVNPWKPDKSDATLEAMWQSLPDYTKGKQNNAIAVVDISGSMDSPIKGTQVTAKSVAISLGLYLAEKATGKWANSFISFSENPKFITLKGKTLKDKVKEISLSEWGFNTNLRKVFTVMLDAAKKGNVSPEDMPESLYIISDMQFDQAVNGGTTSTFESINKMYEDSGYIRPNLIFWNVMEKGGSPAKFMDYGVALISGFSATTFMNVLGDNQTPETFMRSILESDRYLPVREAVLNE
jgi:hypothetical protein